jgi:hypothetical protein
MTFPEESSKFSLEWIDADLNARLWPSAPRTRNAPVPMGVDATIPPGSVSTEFSVKVSKPDQAYITGSVTVCFVEGSINIPMTKGDSVPPSLQLRGARGDQGAGFRPTEPSGEWATFTVTTKIADNYDPSPTVDLTITANGGAPERGSFKILRQGPKWRIALKNIPGRTYDLRFTAEDASGNKTVRSFVHTSPRP